MSAMEAARSETQGDGRTMNIGLLFRDWGIATPICVVEAGTAHLPLIATGGVRNGLDIARALALGATIVGMGFPFLKAASESYEKVCELLETVVAELKVAMQLSGAGSIAAMQRTDIVVTGETRAWLTMRGFEEQYHCKISASYMGSSDELVAKLRGGSTGNYDVISPSSDVATSIATSGLAMPLDLAKIPTYNQLSPKLTSMSLVKVTAFAPDLICL